MRKLCLSRYNAQSFFDDILLSSDTFEEHLKNLDALLSCLQSHGLKARPKKVCVAFNEIEYLGFVVGHGKVKPVPGKVSKVLDVGIPKTKKQVRSFLGMCAFYNKFICSFSELALPLYDLTKKGKPQKIKWTRGM